ncbi:MAG: hypothetical protein BWY09_02496 [Candidatus Hydrogenedentes bacterium ADurb.Bin179]|nr:MAG: hypothetical protein BWY09_02496 [Candidatus Hydrogenedentes bacterium ADurb.Bin179]
MHAGGERFRCVIFMRDRQAVSRTAHGLAVHPQPRLPMTTFQAYQYGLAQERFRNLDVPLVPRRTDIMLVRLQPEQDLRVARFAIGREALLFMPHTAHNGAGPGGFRSHLIADAVFVERPRQAHGTFQSFTKPSDVQPPVFRVQPEPPRACKVNRIKRCGPGAQSKTQYQQQDSHGQNTTACQKYFGHNHPPLSGTGTPFSARQKFLSNVGVAHNAERNHLLCVVHTCVRVNAMNLNNLAH